MRLIVGLGNPGIEYQFTPHNAGFLLIDRLAEVCGVSVSNRRGKAQTSKGLLAGQEILLAKPETFMNLSGLSVSALLSELAITPAEMIVLYDELAFPLGQFRIAERGSANRHNGAVSISSTLGTEVWTRIRIGVGKPPAADGRERRAGGADYLLSPLRKMQLAELNAVLDDAVRAVEVILKDGVAKAMNEFNRKGDKPAPE